MLTPAASSNGAPLSLQLVVKHLSEPLLCRAGQAYEQATEWHNHRPPEPWGPTAFDWMDSSFCWLLFITQGIAQGVPLKVKLFVRFS